MNSAPVQIPRWDTRFWRLDGPTTYPDDKVGYRWLTPKRNHRKGHQMVLVFDTNNFLTPIIGNMR